MKSILVGFGLCISLATTPAALAATKADPCAKITAICEAAGFKGGAFKDGIGLWAHCLAPIMQKQKQPADAKKPLPKVAPALVKACSAANPTFGYPAK